MHCWDQRHAGLCLGRRPYRSSRRVQGRSQGTTLCLKYLLHGNISKWRMYCNNISDLGLVIPCTLWMMQCTCSPLCYCPLCYKFPLCYQLLSLLLLSPLLQSFPSVTNYCRLCYCPLCYNLSPLLLITVPSVTVPSITIFPSVTNYCPFCYCPLCYNLSLLLLITVASVTVPSVTIFPFCY